MNDQGFQFHTSFPFFQAAIESGTSRSNYNGKYHCDSIWDKMIIRVQPSALFIGASVVYRREIEHQDVKYHPDGGKLELTI